MKKLKSLNHSPAELREMAGKLDNYGIRQLERAGKLNPTEILTLKLHKAMDHVERKETAGRP